MNLYFSSFENILLIDRNENKNWNSWNIPSNNPSNFPSNIATLYPTNIPTIEPTDNIIHNINVLQYTLQFNIKLSIWYKQFMANLIMLDFISQLTSYR